MALQDYLTFQSREGLAVGIFIIVLTICISVLDKVFKGGSKTSGRIVALVIAVSSSYYIYKNYLFGYEEILAIFIIALTVLVFFILRRLLFRPLLRTVGR